MYIVRGGVFTDTTFTRVTPGTEESYGPYNSYDAALKQWKVGMFNQKLDICCHRLLIRRVLEAAND